MDLTLILLIASRIEVSQLNITLMASLIPYKFDL
jgi:hypothetical protein